MNDRHMFEVEQSEYEKEQIDWSYIKFNDNKVSTVVGTVHLKARVDAKRIDVIYLAFAAYVDG